MSMPSQQKKRPTYNSEQLPDSVRTQLQNAKELAVNRLLRPNFFGNVVGVGIGRKIIDGDVTETRCIRIYVQSKQDLDVLSPAAVVPSSFLEIPTDIIEVGRMGRAGNRKEPRDDKPENGTGPGPGSSIRLKTISPNVNQAAGGTLGAVVTDGKDRYILSCNHVLAVNGRVTQADIVSPALSDAPKTIGESSQRFIALVRGQSNSVDCAIAPVTGDVKANFRIGKLDPKPGYPDRGQKVKKDGAVTGLTSGTVVDVNADFYVDYSFGTFLFTDQIVIEGDDDNFAAGGDSGSIVVDVDNKKAIAMIFAESGRFAVACPLPAVFEALKIDRVVNAEPKTAASEPAGQGADYQRGTA